MQARFYLLLYAALLAACVSTPEQQPLDTLRGEQLLEFGAQAFRADDYPAAASHFGKALQHYEGLDQPTGIVRSRINLAETALASGNSAQADLHLQAACPLASGEMELHVRVLQSTLALQGGYYEQARMLLEPVLAGRPQDEDVYHGALANRVEVALQADEDVTPWLARYADSLNNGQDRFAARLHQLKARIASQAADNETAIAELQQALAIYEALGDWPGTADTLELWAEIMFQQQHWDSANNLFERALRIRLRLMSKQSVAANLQRLAAINEMHESSQLAATQHYWAEQLLTDRLIDWSAMQREVLQH